MSQHIYWHAPVWEVLLVVLLSLTVLGWLAAHALRRPDVRAALTTLDPALNRRPLFLFNRVHGVTTLNDAAVQLLEAPRCQLDDVSDNPLVETLLEAFEGARVARREGWPTDRETLIAVPIAAHSDVVTGVLAVVAADDLSPPVVRADAGSGLDEAWLALGPALRLHRTLPVVRTHRTVGATEAADTPDWEETRLSHTEEPLLRHLLAHHGEIQSVETLFGVVWPEEEVDRLGLRPDQGDRLRRLVYQLRQHVEPEPASPRYVCTAHGVGYVLYRDPGPTA